MDRSISRVELLPRGNTNRFGGWHSLIVLVGATIVILGRRNSLIHVPSRLASLVTVVAVAAGLLGGFSNAITI